MPLGTPARRMPIPEEVGDFLADLLGAAVSVSKAAPIDLTDEPERFVTARFVDDEDRLGGVLIADLELAASAGAALAMIPAVVAKEVIAAGRMGEGLDENFREVANILTRLLNGPSVPHLRMVDVVEGIPDDVAAAAADPLARKHYDVTIVGYPGGKLALVAARTG